MQSLHYKRVNWVFRVGFLMVSADKISECSRLIVDRQPGFDSSGRKTRAYFNEINDLVGPAKFNSI